MWHKVNNQPLIFSCYIPGRLTPLRSMLQYCRRWNDLKEKKLCWHLKPQAIKKGVSDADPDARTFARKVNRVLWEGVAFPCITPCAGILGVCWSFQRSSRCSTQRPGAKLSEGSSGMNGRICVAVQDFKISSLYGFAKWALCRVKWATLVQATAWTL